MVVWANALIKFLIENIMGIMPEIMQGDLNLRDTFIIHIIP